MNEKFNGGKSQFDGPKKKNMTLNSFSGLKDVFYANNRKTIKDYYEELKNGYFTPNHVIKQEFLKEYPEIIVDDLAGIRLGKNGNTESKLRMSYTQIRNFYDYIRVAESSYRYSKEAGNDSETLKERFLAKIRRLDPMVTYALGRDNPSVTKEFRKFILANINSCNTVEDVINGFLPHFEAVVGYFKYKYPKSK